MNSGGFDQSDLDWEHERRFLDGPPFGWRRAFIIAAAAFIGGWLGAGGWWGW